MVNGTTMVVTGTIKLVVNGTNHIGGDWCVCVCVPDPQHPEQVCTLSNAENNAENSVENNNDENNYLCIG